MAKMDRFNLRSNCNFTESSCQMSDVSLVAGGVSIPGFQSGSECDEYIRIFEYSNILVTNIYSDIRSYQFFFYEYIRTFVRVKFVCTNIFGHSLVSVLECKTKTNIRIYSNIRSIFNTNTYSDIRSCQKN